MSIISNGASSPTKSSFYIFIFFHTSLFILFINSSIISIFSNNLTNPKKIQNFNFSQNLKFSNKNPKFLNSHISTSTFNLQQNPRNSFTQWIEFGLYKLLHDGRRKRSMETIRLETQQQHPNHSTSSSSRSSQTSFSQHSATP
jgi:hypothetical protein